MPPDAHLRPRDASALKPPRFPILPFDEWQISFARGSVFNLERLMPGESLVSILWKFGCANALPGHALLHLISPEADPREGVAPMWDVIDLTRLRHVLRLPSDVLRTSLLSAAPHDRYHEAFRYCRQCAAHGYHSVLYQREDEDRCPAHHQSLQTRCPHCSSETPYIVSADLIGAPFRCVWCHSHYSYGRLSLPSTTPAMRRQDRIAISRRLRLRSGNDIATRVLPMVTSA
ncbi:MAG: hypothetical protein QOF74_8398 [Caballeronia mineralivorans]|jgi:hypothetical protein|nr:hypothetical protein [Caballeronia mineralivorans]